MPLWGDRQASFFTENPFRSSSTIPALRGESSLNPSGPSGPAPAGGPTAGPTPTPPAGGSPVEGGPVPEGPRPQDDGGPPPGADDESGTDPEAGSGPGSPGEPSGAADEGFVPLDQLPDPLSADDIEGMTRDEARSALEPRGASSRASSRSCQRRALREEFELLLARLRRGD